MSHKNKRKFATLAAIAAALAAAAVLGLYRSGASQDVEAAEASPDTQNDANKDDHVFVAVTAVERGDISAFISATANLVAEDEVQVVAEADGKVASLEAEEGDRVREGDRLVQIDPADARLEVERAELNLRNTSIRLTRGEQVANAELISREQLETLAYERDLAQHELDEAKHRLAKTTVRAPFTGRITMRNVQLGQNVKRGDELFTIANFDPLVARVFLPEREVIELSVGQNAELQLKASGDIRFRGRIRQISPVVDTASGTVKVTIEAIEPPSQVRPGAFVSVGIVRETHTAAIIVPRPAVVHELQEAFVFVDEEGIARKRAIRIGLEQGTQLEVLEGLAEGETVVTGGQGALRDGSAIKIAGL
jgi:RND family efflux transporter MFP subunit